MELRHITSFLVLAEELHFGRSAARLHISQPSLSLRLQQLERRVGVRLVAALFPVATAPVLDRAFDLAFDVREYAPGERFTVGDTC